MVSVVPYYCITLVCVCACVWMVLNEDELKYTKHLEQSVECRLKS